MVGRELKLAPGSGQATLAALREATAGHHARIESLLGLGGPFGTRHYGRVLQGFHGFLAAWEPALLAALPPHLHPWFEEGRRHHLLAGDLAALGLPSAPVPAVLPQLPSAAHAIGSLYVLEGSALGGHWIAAGLRKRLGIGPGNGGAYFHGAGAGTVHRWRQFQQLAQAEVATPDARAAAACAAADTFDALAATFRPLLHERAAA
jgi:heme oxygenase